MTDLMAFIFVAVLLGLINYEALQQDQDID
jgi:hypothetical protein